MNTLIEKVLYIPPECCYNPDNFGNPYRYLEMYYRCFLSFLLYRDDHHGGKIPLMHVKSPFETQFHIVYSHANAEDISQLYNAETKFYKCIEKDSVDGCLVLYLLICILMTIQDMA